MEEKLEQNTNINRDCIKIVFYGPESTGKSTLSETLARQYNTVFVEEFARLYAEDKAKQNLKLSKEDVLPIAIGQMKLENDKLKEANKLLICDTDLLETQVYSEYYYQGYCPEVLKKKAAENAYDMYFLTNIDTPWEADGVRDKPNDRNELFFRFESKLIATEKPYIKLSGSLQERLEICTSYIDNLLKNEH